MTTMQNLHTSSFTWCIPAYLLSTRFRDLFLYFDFWLRSITSDYLSRLFSFKNGNNFYQERKEKKKVSKKFNVTLYTYKTSKYMDLSIFYMYIQHRMSTCISPPALLCHKLRDWIDKSMWAFQVPNLTGIRKKKNENAKFVLSFQLFACSLSHFSLHHVKKLKRQHTIVSLSLPYGTRNMNISNWWKCNMKIRRQFCRK